MRKSFYFNWFPHAIMTDWTGNKVRNSNESESTKSSDSIKQHRPTTTAATTTTSCESFRRSVEPFVILWKVPAVYLCEHLKSNAAYMCWLHNHSNRFEITIRLQVYSREREMFDVWLSTFGASGINNQHREKMYRMVVARRHRVSIYVC